MVARIDRITGPSLPRVRHVAVIKGAAAPLPPDPRWVLRGVVSHERYTTREEHKTLARRQEQLGRSTATHAALIPVSKSSAWWQLSQDERRAIFGETSHHIAIGMEYLLRKEMLFREVDDHSGSTVRSAPTGSLSLRRVIGRA